MFGKTFVMYFILLFKWVAFAFFSAIAEGYLYDVKDVESSVPKDKFILGIFNKISFGLITHNEHTILNLVRASVAIGFLEGYPWYSFVFMAIVYVATFPFIHDGTYYWTRHNLNKAIYPRQFMSDPIYDSHSSWRLTIKTRSIMFIVSVTAVLLLTFFS